MDIYYPDIGVSPLSDGLRQSYNEYVENNLWIYDGWITFFFFISGVWRISGGYIHHPNIWFLDKMSSFLFFSELAAVICAFSFRVKHNRPRPVYTKAVIYVHYNPRTLGIYCTGWCFIFRMKACLVK